jgi:hypothetical protein
MPDYETEEEHWKRRWEEAAAPPLRANLNPSEPDHDAYCGCSSCRRDREYEDKWRGYGPTD